jgi:hypothetical protein
MRAPRPARGGEVPARASPRGARQARRRRDASRRDAGCESGVGGARSQAARRGVALSACSYRHTWPRPSLPDSWQGPLSVYTTSRTPVGAEIWALEASRGRSPRAARAGRLGPAARSAPPARAGGSCAGPRAWSASLTTPSA